MDRLDQDDPVDAFELLDALLPTPTYSCPLLPTPAYSYLVDAFELLDARRLNPSIHRLHLCDHREPGAPVYVKEGRSECV